MEASVEAKPTRVQRIADVQRIVAQDRDRRVDRTGGVGLARRVPERLGVGAEQVGDGVHRRRAHAAVDDLDVEGVRRLPRLEVRERVADRLEIQARLGVEVADAVAHVLGDGGVGAGDRDRQLALVLVGGVGGLGEVDVARGGLGTGGPGARAEEGDCDGERGHQAQAGADRAIEPEHVIHNGNRP